MGKGKAFALTRFLLTPSSSCELCKQRIITHYFPLFVRWTTREAASYNFAFFNQSFHLGRFNANRVFISDYVSPRAAP